MKWYHLVYYEDHAYEIEIITITSVLWNEILNMNYVAYNDDLNLWFRYRTIAV